MLSTQNHCKVDIPLYMYKTLQMSLILYIYPYTLPAKSMEYSYGLVPLFQIIAAQVFEELLVRFLT